MFGTLGVKGNNVSCQEPIKFDGLLKLPLRIPPPPPPHQSYTHLLAYKHIYIHLDCKTVRIFACSSTREQSNKRSGTRLKTESETWGHALRGTLRACEPRARSARKTLAARFTDFFTDFEKKNRLFYIHLIFSSLGARIEMRL